MRKKGVKGKLAILLLLVFAVFTATALACGNHTHEFAKGWTYNQTEHWHKATCEHKSVVSGKSAHDLVEETVIGCDGGRYKQYTCICGYSYTENGGGHSHSATYSFDSQTHWYDATCEHTGIRVAEAPHDFTVTVVAPCTVDGYTLYTCVCGYSYKDTPTTATGQHAFAQTWVNDADSHWHPAICAHATEKSGQVAHDFTVVNGENLPTETAGGYIERVCETCGYEVGREQIGAVLTFGASADRQTYVVEKANIPSGFKPEITIPATYNGVAVTGIGPEAFAGTSVAKVTMPSSVVTLSVGMFEGCPYLSEVVIEGNLQKIPASAFSGCTNLESITLPSSITEIGALAFKGCEKLTLDSLPDGLEVVGLSAFNGCKALNVSLPATVREIDDYAFKGSALTSVTVPSTLTVMKAQAFADCTQLKTLTVNASVIGTNAFDGCTALDTVTLEGVQVIGSEAFAGCTKLASLTLPTSVTHVGKGAFDRTGLLSVEDGVQYACGVAMAHVSGTAVSLKAGTVGIAEGAFLNKGITTVNFGDALRFISDNAFRGCTGLKTIALPTSLATIGMSAFRASGLASVTIANTVKTVGDYAFFDCKSLTTASVSAQNIGNFAFSYTPDHSKDVPDGACLASLTLGEGVQTIGHNAFQYLKATSVTLPASLTYIGQYAFAKSSLSTVTFTETSGWKAGNTTLNEGDLTAANLKTTHASEVWTRG